jgi:hypothetical protein
VIGFSHGELIFLFIAAMSLQGVVRVSSSRLLKSISVLRAIVHFEPQPIRDGLANELR